MFLGSRIHQSSNQYSFASHSYQVLLVGRIKMDAEFRNHTGLQPNRTPRDETSIHAPQCHLCVIPNPILGREIIAQFHDTELITVATEPISFAGRYID